MKNNSLLFLVVVCSSLLFIAGCAHYQAKPLKSLATSNANLKDHDVSFAYHIFSKSDCKRYLDRDVIAKGYQPIQISIMNNSNRRLRISTDSFSIPVINHEEVAEKVHTSTIKRATSYGVGALFVFPLIIPAVVDGVGSYQANQELDSDFDQKSIYDKVINPHSTANGLIFAPAEGFNPSFKFSIIDVETNEPFVLSTANPELKI